MEYSLKKQIEKSLLEAHEIKIFNITLIDGTFECLLSLCFIILFSHPLNRFFTLMNDFSSNNSVFE